MKKRLLFWFKIVVLLGIAYAVGRTLYRAWGDVSSKHIVVDWRWGAVALAGFGGSMITSALVWRWLARQMGDRSPALPLVASYTYSQMGKYFLGKVVLLLMRIERSSRFGMSAGVCTLSTLLENALYMISGALVGILAVVRLASDSDPEFIRYRPYLWPVTVALVALLAVACAPPVFFGMVNRLLRQMKKPSIAPEQRLGAPALVLAVLAFTPCWFFGGLAMWGSARCMHDLGLLDCWWFAGAYALSVIIGMASLLPGGALIREAVLGAAAALQFSTMGVPQADAVILGATVAILQRIFQLVVEIFLGLGGMALTARRRAVPGAAARQQ